MNINCYKVLSLFCICLAGIIGVSCSGNTDETEQQLVLQKNKNTLDADGKDMVLFTVLQAGMDVTSDATIRNITTGQDLTGKSFSTTQAGSYIFEASYEGSISGQVSVVANEVSAQVSKFVRRICAMEFTGTWCAWCPQGMTKLAYLIDTYYDGVAYLIAVHSDGDGPDPMAIEQSDILARKFQVSSYPSCVVDMRHTMGLSESYSVMRSAFDESLNGYPAHCGVAIQSEYMEATSQAKVTVRVTSEKTSQYRLVLYAIEDGLKYPQNDGGIYRDYTHHHVLRQLLSATVDGDRLGQIAADKEDSKEYTVILDENWKAENVSFYAIVTDENGYANNLAVCEAVNGNTDYEYVSN